MDSTRKWFTCAPLRFEGNQMFFSRDSGLLCKGFQQIGIDCKAILPGPPMEDDLTDDLIRTDYSNLGDPDWWRSLGGEGVVFYGWGSGKYVGIARAVKQAGMIYVSHMDTAGILGIFNGAQDFGGTLWRMTVGDSSPRLAAMMRFGARFMHACSTGLIYNDWRRSRHLRQADLIGAISPIALERIRKVCRIYGGEALASRVQLVPHPNASYMLPDSGRPKEHLLVAVGRWNDQKVKGTQLLMDTCQILCQQNPTLTIEIYGAYPDAMKTWNGTLDAAAQSRVRLMGVVPNIQVRQALQRARVELCTSLHEGYHTVSAEALCCGCSVVGPDVPEIPSMKWFTDGPFGTMAARNPAAIAAAVCSELNAWESGERDALSISTHWCGILHAPNVARRILQLTGCPLQ
jgi:hypothetical protein